MTKFLAFFVRKFVAQKKTFRAKFALQTCHLNKEDSKNPSKEASCWMTPAYALTIESGIITQLILKTFFCVTIRGV